MQSLPEELEINANKAQGYEEITKEEYEMTQRQEHRIVIVSIPSRDKLVEQIPQESWRGQTMQSGDTEGEDDPYWEGV